LIELDTVFGLMLLQLDMQQVLGVNEQCTFKILHLGVNLITVVRILLFVKKLLIFTEKNLKS